MGKIYIIGDIHGDYRPIKNIIDTVKTDINTIILLGDAGLNYFFNYQDINTKRKINKYGINIFIVRGNHEERPSICMENNPNQWHIEKYWNNLVYIENDFPFIKYALDLPAKYEIPTAQGESIKTLVLPGAYSVDKYYRIANNWNWFPQEQCDEKEMGHGVALAKKSNTWDLVLSHTCPIIYEPTDLFLSTIDQSTVDKTTERWLGHIEYNLDYKLWCWGHYHANRIYPQIKGKDKLMLFNDCFLDLYKYFCGNYNLYNSLIKINDAKIDNLNLFFK